MGINHIDTLNLVGFFADKCGIDISRAKMCELGNQRIHRTVNIPNLRTIGKKGYLAKDYFKQIARVGSHCSVDINGRDGAHAIDLTKRFDIKRIGGPFDIITNFGTTEHVPEQYECFENVHKLCKVGGFIFHVVPRANNWNGEEAGFKEPHCPYYYDVDFFAQLAELTGYELLENRVWNHDLQRPKRAREECVSAMRKVKDTPFISKEQFSKIPLQHIYAPKKTGDYCK